MGTGLTPLGEKQVNFDVDLNLTDGEPGTQADPAVAALSNGHFVVVYENPQAGGSNIDLLAQLFDANENHLVPPVFSTPTGVLAIDRTADVTVHPALAATSNGGFLVAYTDTTPTDNAIVVRRYDDATGISASFVVDSGNLHQPNVGPVDSAAIAAFADGTSVVAWEFDFASSATDHDVYFAFLNSTASGFVRTPLPLAAQNGFEGEPSVATSGNLAAIVYAADPGHKQGDQDIILTLFNSSATEAAAPATIFGAGSLDVFSHPDVAALSNGRFVIVAQDDTASALVASIYDPVTHAVTPLVNFGGVTGAGTNPHVAAAPGGGFIVSFDGPTGDILEARFGPGGSAPFNRDFANSFKTGAQDQNAIAANASGTVFSAWRDAGPGNPNSTDTDTRIEAQAFRLQLLPQPNFNGDNKADILWRNANGDTAVWNSNASNGFTFQDLAVVGGGWQIAGTGDFTGSGETSILWRNADGGAELWNPNGSGGFVGKDLGVVATSWQIAGTGDFNGDGEGILWRNSSGDTELWNANGSGGFVGKDLGVVATSWQIAGTGSFTTNGETGVLWRNANGDTALWNPNGSGGFAFQDLGVVGGGWQVAGTGDFSGTGKDSILWRNSNGDTALWNPNGSGGFAFQDLGVVPTTWQVAGTGDFTGGGHSGILWRNASGDTALWNSNGAGGFVSEDLGVVPTSWSVQKVFA